MCGCKAAPERLRLDVIGADTLAVDLDYRDQLAVARLQIRIAVDFDPLGLEAELLPESRELRLCALAEVASRCLVENDPRLAGLTDRAPA